MLNMVLQRNSATAYRIVNGVALVVGAREGKLRTLNEVGTFIWELADGKLTVSEIVNLMCQEFEVDYSTALNDAQAFIRELESKDMLVVTAAQVQRKDDE